MDTLEGATNLHEAIGEVVRAALEDEALADGLKIRLGKMKERLERMEATSARRIDRASKAAETDATKRALTTFGNCFGLTLYAGLAETDRRARPLQTEVIRASSDQTYFDGAERKDQAQEPRPGSVAKTAGLNSETDPSLGTTAHDETLEVSSVIAASPSNDEPETGGNGKIDKSVLAISEPRRIRDPEHLKYVAEQPCLICGRQPCEAHHLRHAQPRTLGRKASDAYTVPLCALHHRELHARGNEGEWWLTKGRDPIPVADDLWRQSRSG